MTRVKLCGMTSAEDVRALLEIKPDYAGFILSGGFRRSIELERFRELSAMLEGSGISRVGVFVNEPPERIAEVFAPELDLIQLHGSEDGEYILTLKKLTDKPIIKAFTIKSAEDIRAAQESPADYVLLDSGKGTGNAFDHSLIRDMGRPYLLAGGLTPENVGKAVKRFAPFGVDASSSLETDGKKDKSKMSAFTSAARSSDMDYLESFYNSFNEDERLLSKHGQVEYITTMKYIHEYLNSGQKARILEVGAGTGRYSIALAEEGHSVTAVELVEHNIDVLKSKLTGNAELEAVQGNALDLSRFGDDTFDMTLLLGPMYHLYTREDMLTALSEAVRVTKQGGYILAAYCMNEAAVIQHAFLHGNLQKVLDNDMLAPDWHCKSEPKELFELVRTEEIASLDAELPVERIKLIAADGAANYHADAIDAMDSFTFEKYMEYHLAICERQDLIGASNHALDILRKV